MANSVEFAIGEGDRLPSIQASLLGADGLPVDLTGATMAFRMLRSATGAVVLVGAAVVVGDPLLGVVRYDWAAGNTDEPGYYDAEWVATMPGAKPMTFPGHRYNRIRIKAKL